MINCMQVFRKKFQYETKRGSRESVVTGPDPDVLYQRRGDWNLPACIHCHS